MFWTAATPLRIESIMRSQVVLRLAEVGGRELSEMGDEKGNGRHLVTREATILSSILARQDVHRPIDMGAEDFQS